MKKIIILCVVFLFVGMGFQPAFANIMENNPPYAPSNYSIDEVSEYVVNLSWDGGDPDPGDTVYYDVYFDDVDPPFNVTTVGPYPWNQTRIEYGPVELECYKTYYMQIGAYDNHGAYVEGPVYSFTTGDNHPPEAPTIDGPANCKPEKPYDFMFNAEDPEGHDVRFHIDWGDGHEEITDYVGSGWDITASHAWSKSGYYTIFAKAEDEHGAKGNESTYTFLVGNSKAVTNNLFLQRLLDRFPILQKLIHQLGFGLKK